MLETWEGVGGGAWLTYESGLAHFDLPCPLFTPSQYTICQHGLAIYKIPPAKNVSKYAPLKPQNMPSEDFIYAANAYEDKREAGNQTSIMKYLKGLLKTVIPSVSPKLVQDFMP